MNQYLLHVGDACIPIKEPEGFVELWRVRGLAGVVYPTKMAAEISTRLSFPDEDPDERYSRISYRFYFPQG